MLSLISKIIEKILFDQFKMHSSVYFKSNESFLIILAGLLI